MSAVVIVMLLLAGLIGVALTLIGLPGIWLTIGVAAAVDFWRPDTFSTTALVIALLLGLAAEFLELVTSGVGAQKAGGGRRSALAAIGGGIVGALAGTVMIPIPVAGTILGGAIGAGVCAMIADRTAIGRRWADAYRVGRGAAIGRAVATVIKTGMAIVIALYLLIASVV